MTKECVIFFTCLAFGCAYKLTLLIAVQAEKRARLKPVTFVLDFTVTAAALSALALFLLLYNDGIAEPYMLLSFAAGFALITLLFSKTKSRVQTLKLKKHEKKHPSDIKQKN